MTKMDAATDQSPEQMHPMYPVGVKKQFDRIGRIRVLLVGRSNAGKTTLLQCVYSATKLPEVFNTNGERIDSMMVQGSLERGYHDIQNELIFRSSPGIIFHDSRGFEAGSEDEVMLVKNFIVECTTTMQAEKKIHAIWYCIPGTDEF
ncbi:hypothetical protein J3A83DRAFT_1996711 [Scleroderma citrinum]